MPRHLSLQEVGMGELVPTMAKASSVRRKGRRIGIILVALTAAIFGYEVAVRVCTAKWGEVDVRSRPPRVYYVQDLLLPVPILRRCFGFRTGLPLGKVRLSKRTGAYVDGGRFYRRLPDGSWRDFTDDIVAYQNLRAGP
jgi:hypothetical protein